MTITQVMYVLEVARCQNVSRAAERLFVSQPALSVQIRKLEEELGCELLRREHQGVSLTAAGKAFCAAAGPVETAWKSLQEETRFIKDAVCRQVRIGVGPRAFSNGLVDVIISFFDQHPETEVSFITDIGEDTLNALDARRMDLAIDRLPPAPLLHHRERFSLFELLTERQCILMSLEDPRSAWEEISFQSLQGGTVVSGPVGSPDDLVMQESCRNYNVWPSRVYRADNLDAVMSLIQRGKGVALGPRSFAKHYKVAAVPVAPPTDIGLFLICLRQNQKNSLVVQLNQYLQTFLSEHRLSACTETASIPRTPGR